MRHTTISSTFASLVSFAANCVTVVGIDARGFLPNAILREQFGHWQELYQSRSVECPCQLGVKHFLTTSPGLKPGLRPSMLALAIYPAQQQMVAGRLSQRRYQLS